MRPRSLAIAATTASATHQGVGAPLDASAGDPAAHPGPGRSDSTETSGSTGSAGGRTAASGTNSRASGPGGDETSDSSGNSAKRGSSEEHENSSWVRKMLSFNCRSEWRLTVIPRTPWDAAG